MKNHPNQIDKQLDVLKKQNRIGLMTHLVAGYPDTASTKALIEALIRGGADFLELQIPFSDPVADGPTIMRACEEALNGGITVRRTFALLDSMKQTITIPALLMCYYNTVFRFGVEEFCKHAQSAGVSGLIVPDMPVDEEPYEHFLKNCEAYNLYPILVISPASTPERLILNARNARGFVYCISRYGVTGSKSELDPKLSDYLQNVGRYFSITRAVGFGISKRSHIEALSGHAGVAIVGSAIIDVIAKADKNDAPAAVEAFVNKLTVST